MKISQYIVEYTSNEYVPFAAVWGEIKELLVEILHFNVPGIKEEREDVLHFLQLWFYWRWQMDGEIWSCTKHSAAKFMARLSVWQAIYDFVGLPKTISNFCGNYNKVEKVIKQLAKYTINEKNAVAAYNAIVLK